MVIRNLRAIKDLRTPAMPNVAIGQAGQVNVGAQQVNAVATTQAPPVPSDTDVREGSPATQRSEPVRKRPKRLRQRSGAEDER